MKLSKMLFASGALGSGRVRHCSEWEFDSPGANSRFGVSPALRKAVQRRAAVKIRRRRRLLTFPAAVIGRICGK